MAGHSKWANTKHRKAAQDAKRGKIFTKIIRELVTAARLGGGDPASNPRLRAAVDKALSNNMTRDTLNRAIARGVGGDEDANMETIIYEGYGPGGTAVMVECLSDNRNRTVAEVRHAFTKTGGNLGTDGSVSYLFSKKGVISFEKGDEDTIMEAALEAGAEDVVTYDDGAIDVYTASGRDGRCARRAGSRRPESRRCRSLNDSVHQSGYGCRDGAEAAASDRYARRLRRRAGSVP